MPIETQYRVRRRLLLPAYAVYTLGLAISVTTYFHGKSSDIDFVLLSDLASPKDNPHGYLALTLATSITALLFIPAITSIHRRLQPTLLRAIASLTFGIGLTSMLAIAVLSPFTAGYDPLHIQLAYATFAGLITGIALYLIVARGSRMLIALQAAVFTFLALNYFGLDLLAGTHFFNTLAFCEWCLVLDCAVALWILAGIVERREASH